MHMAGEHVTVVGCSCDVMMSVLMDGVALCD